MGVALKVVLTSRVGVAGIVAATSIDYALIALALGMLVIRSVGPGAASGVGAAALRALVAAAGAVWRTSPGVVAARLGTLCGALCGPRSMGRCRCCRRTNSATPVELRPGPPSGSLRDQREMPHSLCIAWEHACCPLCGADQPRPFLRAKDRLFGMPGEFQLVRCERCRHAYLNRATDRGQYPRFLSGRLWTASPFRQYGDGHDP